MLPGLLAPHAGRTYAILRIVSGLAFAFHGAQILAGILGVRFGRAVTDQLPGRAQRSNTLLQAIPMRSTVAA